MYKIDQLDIIEIGVVGENEAKIIEIDVRPWLAKWPDARFGITATRPGEDISYPCQSELENGILKWIVTGGDVAISGRGKMDVRAYQDTIVAKTPVIMTIIEPTMPGTEGEAPEAEQGWMDQAHGHQIAAEKAEEGAHASMQAAKESEESAHADAQEAEASARNAEEAQAGAEEAWQKMQALDAEAETLGAGEEATAKYDKAQNKLFFGVPQGVKGDKGDKGVSPTISTKKTGKTTTVTVTDAEGTKTFQVLDGADGQGAGDMLASTYDPDKDGQVEKADYADEAGHATNADNATNAGRATNADNATNAGHATNADNATNAATAANAEKLGGAAPSAYRKTADQIDYETEIKNKPIIKVSNGVTVTVPASAWAGDEAPFTATVACSNATASNILQIGPAGHVNNADQRAAIAAAMITATGQGAGTITLTADGDKPETDISVNVVEVV